MTIYTQFFSGAAMVAATSVLMSANAAGDATQAVTEEAFIRAEVDARILAFQEAGGLNRGVVFTDVTPTDNQPVPRMNRDTIYHGIPVDTKDGFTITIPELPDDRYFSIYMLDNDHFTIDILRDPGTYEFEAQDTRYIVAIPRVQVRDASDPADIATANKILAGVKVESGSMEPKEIVWDWEAMMRMRAEYEARMVDYAQYPPSFQDTRASGMTVPEEHRIAVAGSWGLFPNYETVYISDQIGGATDNCFSATYEVPEFVGNGFWSITMYNRKAYMFSDNAILNAGNTQLNEDGTFTAYYGSEALCGDVPNRLDITDGWRILMRVYRPGESVSAGKYKMPEITAVSTAALR